MNKNYLDSDNNKTRQTDYEENESRKTFELVVMKEMELLTSRVNKFENIARVLQPINSGVDLSNSSNFDSERSERSRSQKKVHVKPSPSNIFGPKELPINEIIGSKIRENINVGSAKSITLLDGTTCDQSSPSINSTEIENNDTLSSYIINRQASYSTTEKYILTNQQPNALLKHIEKILGRMNKVEHEIQMLMEKENNLSESKSIYSETSSDDVNLEPDISHYVRFNLHESVMQEVKLKTLGKKDVFQRLFRVTQKKKDLDSYLTVRNFRSFLEDYTEKFGIIHEFLMFHNERIMTKVDSKDYESFKNTVRITHHEIKNDIKEYTLRDPEAAGIVHFVKDREKEGRWKGQNGKEGDRERRELSRVEGVTCISCEKPVMMKTTNVPFKHPTKGVFLPRPSLKAHLTYELDRVRKQYNRTPGTRDMNLSLKCKEPA
ncbi:Hypothetical protein CINCED_3A020114 [Cinara cedri]|uniref:Uncharacterized protein n=1 Tax=Cinara cedri TaxID=506608 RepID=A0A5E4NF11_9HEMI|nr:Hypothetical protein CINCED_3A020114 [Cinara cedri]